jgi:hypothetical protein
MNQELEALLQVEYQYAVEAQIADEATAQQARNAGEMARYFDLSVYTQLADLCWALERWEEAQHWHRHNAHIMMEARAWRAKHSGPDYPLNAISDQEASALIMAGDLEAGREHLKEAFAYWQIQPDNKLILAKLGLHAAQAGLSDFAEYALEIIPARQELPGGDDETAIKARELLHYEPAQVNLLLGRWDEFLKGIEKLVEAEQLVKGKPGSAFPDPMQDALVAASRGLRTLASLYTGAIKPERGRLDARQAFEEAMLQFYRFSEYVDWNSYFMRLNTRFADELAAGQPIDQNPFADRLH